MCVCFIYIYIYIYRVPKKRIHILRSEKKTVLKLLLERGICIYNSVQSKIISNCFQDSQYSLSYLFDDALSI